jgi:TPR repeat protein
LYQQAIAQGDIDSLYALGTMYDRGLGVEQSYERAKEYYAQAANFGRHNNANAIYNLGFFMCYYLGQGVEQSYEKAIEYCERAAHLGHGRSMNHLG